MKSAGAGRVMFTFALQATMQVMVGTLLNAGVPCPDIRLDDGSIQAVSGLPSFVKTGDRISIAGRHRHSFSCQKEVFAAASVNLLPAGESPAKRD
jgi:hypothetical protein